MRRVVIYAKGQLFLHYLKRIEWDEVIAIIDKNAKQGELFNDKPVFLPQHLTDLQYDYIVIFSDHFFEDICLKLINCFSVPKEKIISWRIVIKEEMTKCGFFEFLYQYLNDNNINYVLDYDNSFLFQYYLTKESIRKEMVRLDGIGNVEYSIVYNLYDHIYNDDSNLDFDSYDIILMWKIPVIIDQIENLLNKSKVCLLMIGYEDTLSLDINEITKLVKKYGKVRIFQTNSGWVWEIKRKLENDQTHIYVVTHKEYNVLKNDLYIPICVGNNYFNSAYLSEKKGQNISYLNEKINECTALYWIWKNTNDKYVGLNHYRRYFCNTDVEGEEKYLQKNNIEELLKEYDIILANIAKFESITVVDQIKGGFTNSYIYQNGYMLVRRGIQENQPAYLESFDQVMHGHRVYLYNLFVTKRNILNAYCEWLFSFIIDVAEKLDISTYNDFEKRIIGFFAERLLTVWLLNQNLKIKELPVLMKL